jgi:CheY-like chemotaxis protein
MTLIAVSGWGQAGDLARSREAGIDEHLLKPVDPARLREVLERSVVA